jgi:hypothetical protein
MEPGSPRFPLKLTANGTQLFNDPHREIWFYVPGSPGSIGSIVLSLWIAGSTT